MTRFAVFFSLLLSFWLLSCNGTNWLDENLDATTECESAVLHVLDCCKDADLASRYEFACLFYAKGATEAALSGVVDRCVDNGLLYGNPAGFDTLPGETMVSDPVLPRAKDLSSWSCEDALAMIHQAYGAPVNETPQEDGDDELPLDGDEDGDISDGDTDGDTDGDLPDPCDNVDCSHLDNLCGEGSCQNGNCVLVPRNEDADCSSMVEINDCQQALCQSGQCRVGSVPNSQTCALDVPNDCLIGVCLSGSCRAQAKENGETCNDESACTGNDACQDGTCVGQPVIDCEDDNPCTIDTCNPQNGLCEYDQTTLAGTTCDDGNPCTDTSSCQGGLCTGQATDCSDGLSCTEDRCLGGGACENPLLDGRCLIGGVCYEQNQSNPQNGCQECRSTTPQAWTVDNTNACSDGNEQTGNDRCQSGVCVGDPCSCSTTDTCCDGCVPRNENATCEDGNPETDNERCRSGLCDADACVCDTTDTCCDGCSARNVGQSCNDGLACSHTDVCTAQGICQGQAYSCDDGLSCTADACTGLPNGCQNSVLPGSCHIVNLQTGQAACYQNGNVKPDNPCQICNASSPAWWTNNDGGACNDQNVCTQTDTCHGGSCVGSNPVTCAPDSDPCTDDVCDPVSGCHHPQSAPGTPCTDDGQFCTDDVCNIQGACIHIPGASGCYIGGVCYQPGSANPSQPECQVCNPGLNLSAFSPANLGQACTDTDPCSENETCQADGSCGGEPKYCGESTICQVWECDSFDGSCSLSFTDNACDDDNPCTENDHCGTETGLCDAGTPLADDTTCNDETDTTVNDRCQSGTCEGDTLPLALVEGENAITFAPTEQGTTSFVCISVRVGAADTTGLAVSLQSPTGPTAILTESAPGGTVWEYNESLGVFSGEDWQGDWTLLLVLPPEALPAQLEQATLELGCPEE